MRTIAMNKDSGDGVLGWLVRFCLEQKLVVLMMVLFFGWPVRNGAFNVWINLPTFDPTAGGDVVARLIRDSRINLILGGLLPFLMPVVASYGIGNLGISLGASPITLVWMVTLSSVLPVSLLMRGMAMGRIAYMITERRKKLVRDMAEQGEFAPA